jgi:hypothetical protein
LGIIKTRYFKKIKKNMRKNLASEWMGNSV